MFSAARTLVTRQTAATRLTPSFTRAFSSSPATLGLFSDYIATLKSSVKEISPEQLNSTLTKDPINGPSPTFHVLDVREV